MRDDLTVNIYAMVARAQADGFLQAPAGGDGYFISIVFEARKVEIANRTLNGPVSPLCLASILRHIAHAHLYLDAGSGSRFRR